MPKDTSPEMEKFVEYLGIQLLLSSLDMELIKNGLKESFLPKSVVREKIEQMVGIIVKNSAGFDEIVGSGKKLWRVDLEAVEEDLSKELGL